MNWKALRRFTWLDRRARFIWRTPGGGRHLDVGCSVGDTLGHFVELRSDLEYSAVDVADFSERMPGGVRFERCDLVGDTLPFESGYFDSVTMMHVLEHLPVGGYGNAAKEIARVLQPGGRLYVEGPGPRSVLFPSSTRTVTLNFYDDPTHIAPLSKGRIARVFGEHGLDIVGSGSARSWPLILGMPLSLMKRDYLHFLGGFLHLFGWVVYVEFVKREED
ncbi:MAG: class I SAM-dependent methyltransferase [Verrucomicrobia bacterium]|nr:class I SAM-dependent methyltransferase [Verrucomicrobiota bacterium]